MFGLFNKKNNDKNLHTKVAHLIYQEILKSFEGKKENLLILRKVAPHIKQSIIVIVPIPQNLKKLGNKFLENASLVALREAVIDFEKKIGGKYKVWNSVRLQLECEYKPVLELQYGEEE